MRRRAAAGVVLALATTACAQDEPPVPRACLDTDAARYAQALARAPEVVRLPGGVAISECLRRARTNADLQNLGLIVQDVAQRLAERARRAASAQDAADAARALGYLGGATAVGAQRSNGISAELARRVAVTGTDVASRGAVALRALREGQDAGEAGG